MNKLYLDGRHLTLEDLEAVARGSRPVEMAPAALHRIQIARETMHSLAQSGQAIYGFNRGVGWNKDQAMGEESLEEYNRRLIRSHSLGVPPYHTEEEGRAILCVRLNQMLLGAGCATTELALSFRDFLNHGITPRIPCRGSMGDDDIATLSHIGSAMMGEGEVWYRGEAVPAAEALAKEGLSPLTLRLKDAHTIILSNAQGEAMSALLVLEARRLLRQSQLVYCLDYEGLNGVIQQMGERVNALRGLPGQIRCAAECRAFLAGSYLHEPDPDRALQDPLSFRDGFAVSGAVADALDVVERFLSIQLNSTSDNPCVLTGPDEVSVTANFEDPSLTFAMEMLNISLATLSRTICYRMLRMTDPAFTGLTRYLAPWDGSSFGFATIMNTYGALDAENRSLAMPSSPDFHALEGGIEDRGTNLPLIVQKTKKLLENLSYLIGMEAMYAAQAVDLRMQKSPIALGEGTGRAYRILRESIPFLKEDRNMHQEICRARELILSGKLLF